MEKAATGLVKYRTLQYSEQCSLSHCLILLFHERLRALPPPQPDFSKSINMRSRLIMTIWVTERNIH